jgi:EAL domain-containing protein (putative c-di-GMP-specific phosphodiesterase class I)
LIISELLPFPEHVTFLPSFLRFGDLNITSNFQPIFSFSHRKSIGYEALLRARDPAGKEISPRVIFGSADAKGQWSNLERGAQFLHVCNFARVASANDVLFLNTRPDGFIVSEAYRRRVESTLRRINLAPERIVLEVLETPNGNLQRLIEGTATFRKQGYLIALDDFGAGHSNIDRVWQLQPDIVKLDRRVIEQAATFPRVARSLPRPVSLLHETGALVLIEGVETQQEALLAMECDADLAQGFYFSRPSASGIDLATSRTVMDSLWDIFRSCSEEKEREKACILSVYAAGLQIAAKQYSYGIDIASACGDFLELQGASRCFVLNAQGVQMDRDLIPTQSRMSPSKPFPFRDGAGACWERRSYFRHAISRPGTIQITEPYLSINGVFFCVTLSIAMRIKGELRIMCADVEWSRDADT